MIGLKITDDKGEVVEQYTKLSKSTYQPPSEVLKLFARVQQDYQIAYALQHRSFNEFDGYSLLQRAKMDQETFGAYVGATYVAEHKRWRFKGRKNTARNKLIGILSNMLAGILYPYVNAKNEQNEDDKMTARVMRILVEDHLKKANYEMKFLYMVLSALVNPAVFCEIEYVEAIQRIKQQMKDGTYKIKEVVDQLLSGLNLNIVPIDEILLPDFYTGTGDLQRLPNILRVRRIPWDEARAKYSGKYFDDTGVDLIKYVEPGKTRIVLTGQEGQQLYDIAWTEADRNYVQEITAYYKYEDLELKWVGGVGMFNYKDPMNSNPFEHRRLTLIEGEWLSVPVYKFAVSGYEPLDPTGRFFYYKSGAYKEYWDDQALNKMHQIMIDGTHLDVLKPMFIPGAANIDSSVIAPGAVVGIPGAPPTAYSLGPNLAAVYQALSRQNDDMSESTQDKVMAGKTQPNVTATQTAIAAQQAKVSLGLFGIMIASLIKQVGELTIDCVIQYSTVGELSSLAPESLDMKFHTFLVKGKDKGKDVTNRVVFSTAYMGRKLNDKQIKEIEWGLYDKSGGADSDQRIYMVNPYQFARYSYTMEVDVDQLVQKAMGNDRNEKILAFNMLTDPRVAPFTDQKSVIDDLIIDEFGGSDPDKYKSKGTPGMMPGQPGAPQPGGALTGSMGQVQNNKLPIPTT